MKSEVAFILGNGITRRQYDCKQLLHHGTVYGCNRIYEEFAPDVLVSTDPGMAKEIQQSGYSRRYTHYTRHQHIEEGSGALALPTDLQGMSSGPAALGLASRSQANYLYMIGMDLKGWNNKINNIYAGTLNYKPEDYKAVHFGNWVDQTCRLMQEQPTKRFFHVNPLDDFVDPNFLNHDNFSIVTLNEFKQMINNS